MKIELAKEEKISGQVWFHVIVDGHYEKSFYEADFDKAKKCYDECVARHKAGFPRTSTVFRETL